MQPENNRTDSELFTAASNGDERAAAQLYYRHAERVFRVCFRVLSDRIQAKDCAQEVWLKVFRYRQRFRAGSSFHSWLTAIAVHTAIDAVRKNARMVFVDVDENLPLFPCSQTEDALQQLENRKIRERIDQALARMSVQQRVAFVLRHYEDEPLATIAHVLNCSIGTVKTHIHRAVLALRKELSEFTECKNVKEEHEERTSHTR
ncbi:MAG: RNA polymerase sigma factor [Candidatus Omnitrophota bacterium]|jgi:RNA polymerase sigma-70 factor (ECF subfamily)|nr:MAG: RNA polymerase sigma factor [Candidatus Omnitrophota bacterium]